MNYVGQAGAGTTTLIFEAQTISGFDTFGRTYDGTYTREDSGSFRVSVMVTVPPAVGMVTGIPGQAAAQSFLIEEQLPATFANSTPVTISVNGQPVQVAFVKIRTRRSPTAA